MIAALAFAGCAAFGVIAAVWTVTTERRAQRALIDAAPDGQRSAQIQIAQEVLAQRRSEGAMVLLASLVLGAPVAVFAEPLLHWLGVLR